MFCKNKIITNLTNFRHELESEERPVSNSAYFMLYDVCFAIGLTDGEIQHIVGPAYFVLIESPISVDWGSLECFDE